jgi:hypothetical protein
VFGPTLIVSHNSNCIGALHFLNEDQGKESDNEIVAPGGIFKISKKGDKLNFEVIFKDGDSQNTGS